MPQEAVAKIHPREIELANLLKEFDLPWEIRTGDWFYANDTRHTVLAKEEQDGRTFLCGVAGNRYLKDAVLWLPHRTYCLEWLMNKEWEVTVAEPKEGKIRACAHRRKSECRVEKAEPTELAAIYSVLLEILEMIHFGWA